MIRCIEQAEEFIRAVNEISDGGPFACRLISLCRCYAPALPFVDYWLAYNENEAVTAALSRNGSTLILLANQLCNTEELSGFIITLGVSSVLCDAALNLRLNGAKQKSGPILVREELIHCGCSAMPLDETRLREIYEVLSKSSGENFSVPDFDGFYVDMNHRLRHKAARVFGEIIGDTLAAVAMTVAETENCAVLGAVACRREFRGHGVGSDVTACLSNELLREGKRVFLHRAQNENERFYDTLGFEKSGEWREYYL